MPASESGMSGMSGVTSRLSEKYPFLSGLSGGALDAVEELKESHKAVNFFGLSAVFMVSVAAIGAVLGALTNSDMVQVDFWDMCADIIGLCLSICVEKYKQYQILQMKDRLESRRNVLIADICGGISSFLLLTVVVVSGTVLSVETIEDVQQGDLSNAIHQKRWVLVYGFVSMFGDIIPLWISRSTCAAAVDSDANKLNVLSGIMHMGIDLLRAMVTIIGTSYMLMTNAGAKRSDIIDGYGSMGICILVLCTAVYVAHEAVGSFREILALSEELKTGSETERLKA